MGPTIHRRRLGQLVGMSVLAGATSKATAADVVPPLSDNVPSATARRSDKRLTIGMVIYHGMTTLDFAGPADVFSRPPSVKVVVLAKTLEPVVTDTYGRILPDRALRDAPELDILFIGGGLGVAAIMEDGEVIEFLRSRAENAKWVTSVCTGALVLGAAGLLRGYKATTHWSAMALLPLFGAEPVNQRVIIDRNRITGAGVTAGIDFALTVASVVWGPATAQLLQLGEEYDPAPPFNAGTPRTAPPDVVARYRAVTAASDSARRTAATRIASAFK